jgi:hypothetical protein
LQLPEIDQIPVVNTFIHFAEPAKTKRAWSAEARKRESSVDSAEGARPGSQVASETLAQDAPGGTFTTPKRKVEANPLSPLRTPLPSLSPTTKKNAMTQTPTSMLRGSREPLGEGIRLAQSNPNATGYAFREEQTPGRLFPHDFVTPLRQYRANPVLNGLGQVDAIGQPALPASASASGGDSCQDLDLTPARPAARRRRGGRGRGGGLTKKDKENQNQDQTCAAQGPRQRRMSDNV